MGGGGITQKYEEVSWPYLIVWTVVIKAPEKFISALSSLFWSGNNDQHILGLETGQRQSTAHRKMLPRKQSGKDLSYGCQSSLRAACIPSYSSCSQNQVLPALSSQSEGKAITSLYTLASGELIKQKLSLLSTSLNFTSMLINKTFSWKNSIMFKPATLGLWSWLLPKCD